MTFEIVKNEFIKDGKPVKLISGAVHYFRNMPDTWEDIFKKLLAMGCNCVETYCAWNMHEKKQGEFDFTGILDIAQFIKTAGELGLMAIVRPGPYICIRHRDVDGNTDSCMTRTYRKNVPEQRIVPVWSLYKYLCLLQLS